MRGNGKIIQELEGYFRGAGWNVIKVVWGRLWDPLLARDEDGLLQQAMNETVDGEYQNFKAKGGAYVRNNFGQHPQLLDLVSDMTDEDIIVSIVAVTIRTKFTPRIAPQLNMRGNPRSSSLKP